MLLEIVDALTLERPMPAHVENPVRVVYETLAPVAFCITMPAGLVGHEITIL